MSMWARMTRVFRSFFGAMVGAAENPKLILEQNMRDMRDKVPVMNDGIAKARAGIIRIEREIEQHKEAVAKFTARVKACLLGGDESLAGQYAVQLKKEQDLQGSAQSQLDSAKVGYEALLKLKERYMREMKMKTEDAMRAIREADASKWKSELADVFETFEVAGVDATHDEMIDKLRNKSAEAEGRIAMAVESVDMKQIEMEERAQALEGSELLKQFKLDLGLEKKPETATQAEPVADAKKTIGPERTKA